MKDENAVKAQNTVSGAAFGDCGAVGTAEDPARRYFALHGITVEIRESRCVRALRLRLAGVDPEMRVGLKLLYLGPDREAGRGRTETYAAPGNDPYVYGAVGSPFPETPDPLRSYGLTREEDGTLWTSYYSRVSLKDPELYEKGLLFTFEIPEITAEKAPEITVFCEGREILRETVRQSGVHSFRLDFRSCADGLLRYMAEMLAELYEAEEDYTAPRLNAFASVLAEREEESEAALHSMHGHILENLAVNELFLRLYPFSCAGGFLANFKLFVLRFRVAEFPLLIQAFAKGAPLDEETALLMLGRIMEKLDHNRAADGLLKRHAAEDFYEMDADGTLSFI